MAKRIKDLNPASTLSDTDVIVVDQTNQSGKETLDNLKTYITSDVVATKADTTYVDAELATKSDTTYVDAELATKSDAIAVVSIAALKGLTGSADNQSVEVLGYHTEGDGGGGTFYWDASSTEDDNTGTIIESNAGGTGRWKRVYSGAVDVKWFGAKGDGSTDDTAAIQDAIDTGGHIEINSGDYKYSDTLEISKILSDSETTINNLVATTNTAKVVNIPSDFPDLQSAIDVLSKSNSGSKFNLNIESGHNLTRGVYLSDGNYGNFIISSEDSVVSLSASFVGSNNDNPSVVAGEMLNDTVLAGENTVLPRLSTVIDMNHTKGDGLFLRNTTIKVDPDCGVINAGRRGIQARERSSISATDSNFSGANWNGIKAQHGCIIALNGCDMSNCCNNAGGYTGPDVAAAAAYFSKGCFVSFRVSDVSDSGANGLEVRRSFVDAESIDASGALGDSGQFPKGCVVAQSAAFVNVVGSNLSGGYAGIHCNNGSSVNARSVDCSGSTSAYSVYVRTGAKIQLGSATLSDKPLYLDNAGEVYTSSTETKSSVSQTSGTLKTTHESGSSVSYRISNYVAGDDFTNVGASSNGTNVIFKATGTTPTTWTNGSTLVERSANIADFDPIYGTIDLFNNVTGQGLLINTDASDSDGYVEFLPTLTDNSGNDVSDGGGSYGTRVGFYRFIGLDKIEISVNVIAVKGTSVVGADRIYLSKPTVFTPASTQYVNVGVVNSGLNITSGAMCLNGTLLNNGKMQFNATGAGVNNAMTWNHVTGTFGINFHQIFKIS